MKIVIYCRVSTEGQTLDQQIEACKRFAEYKGFEVLKIYTDVMSGTKENRPGYQEMLKDMRKGYFNGLIVFKLDRLGRKSRELFMLVDEFESRRVELFSINENLDTTTPVGRAVRDILLILAQMERDNLSQATKHRLQALKNMGKKLGRPEISYDHERFQQLVNEDASVRKIARELKLSIGKVQRIKKTVSKTYVLKPSVLLPRKL